MTQREESGSVEALILQARKASPELCALARRASRALDPLELSAPWTIAAAAVPLLSAGALSEHAAREALGPHFELVRHAAELPDPRLAAPEAMRADEPVQAENLRQLFLGLIRDIRIVPLVLAQQLARAEGLKNASADEQREAAHAIFTLYAPLANRLGIWQLKWPLEDLALRLAEPEQYVRIARGLAERRDEREQRLIQTSRDLQDTLTDAGIQAEISGRPKHIYSIWRKMQRKDVALDELYDLMALRIIVDDVAACYAALGAVHGRWRHIATEFDDYIAAPKGNFYRSLHTAILDEQGRALEVQIRTRTMHRDAELGVAAHWRYKESDAPEGALNEHIAWMRQILSSEQDAEGQDPGFVSQVTAELATERTYVLTPRGRVVDLPLGATVLDFAYAVHTGLGHRTAGARVNGRMVPLTHPVATGDTVQILTHAQPRPSRDWLRPENGYLQTRRARQKLRAWFRNAETGTDSQPLTPAAQPRPRPTPQPRRAPAAVSLAQAVVSGMPELATEFARCCNPHPGEAIAAFVTRGHGIRVHRRDCVSFSRSAQRAPQQVLDASWGSGETTILVIAKPRPDLVESVVASLAAQGLALRGLDTEHRDGTTRLRLHLTRVDSAVLPPALSALAQLAGVNEARLAVP
ncbi:MAG: RelA/SpoT family protein [Gammaproteobacteria bacterium]